ncbi:MAG: glycosyltransferase family 2 protein, partial [Acidimicrobiales bacterium]
RSLSSTGTSVAELPEVSVCVTTRDRAHLLPRLVEALEAQTLGVSNFEVVVTDDGSVDDTFSVLRNLAESSSLQLRPLRHRSSRGPGAGRNLAWQTARGGIVAFIDDDCVPTPGWLEAHLQAQTRAEITQGRVEADSPPGQECGPFARSVSVPDENGLYETCNICYRRQWLVKMGGFDGAFRKSGEDADLAWRAKGSGASTAFVPDALVYHDVNPSSWRRAMRDTLRWTGVVRLVDRHPHLRSRFGSGPTWRKSHAPAALAAGGIAAASGALLAGRPRLALGALIAVVPYARHRLRVEPLGSSRSERILLVPPQLAIDVAEAVVIVSTRARLRFDRNSRATPAHEGRRAL